MGIVTFTRAQRKGAHVIITLYGESGSGKTLSAIMLARGLVGPEGKLAVLDTEAGRALIYANVTAFDHAELTPPFSPDRYCLAIKDAESAGYQALVIDQASSAWEGLGGILEQAEAGKNQKGEALQGLVKWSRPKAIQKKFVQTLITTPMHLIICLRAKEKMVQKGGEISSGGYVPIQDKRFIYETTVQLFMPTDQDVKKRGIPRIDKCPEDLLPAFPPGERISIATGERIAEWVAGGAPVDHVLETLRREAEEAADGGLQVLESMWKRLNNDQKRMLQPYLDNLKSIAATADAEPKAEAESAETPDE